MSDNSQSAGGTRDEAIAKIAELIAGTQVCMFTTMDTTGLMVSRPMAVLETEFDGDLWFVTDGGSRKADQVRHGAHVNVSFSSRGSWVSIPGDAEIVRDVGKAKELWGPGVEAWFPEGPEAPNIVLLKACAESAEYWDTPGGPVTGSLLSFVKSRVTGKSYDVENETVDL